MVEALVAIQALLCFLPWFFVFRKRLHPLSAPVFVGLLFSHIYVMQPIARIRGGVKLITWEMLEFGLVVSILALGCLYLGWLSSSRWRAKSKLVSARMLDSKRLMVGSIGLACLSLLGWVVFSGRSGGVRTLYSASHVQAGNWEGVTGYIYNLPKFVVPAVCVMLVAAHISRSKDLQMRANRLAIVLSLAWLGHTVLTGSRGGLLLIAAPWVLFSFACKGIKRVKVFRTLATYAVLAIGFQFLVGFRDYIHLGAEDPLGELTSGERWKQALIYNTFVPEPEHKANTEIDYHSAETYLFWRNGRYNWGSAFINPIINFLPRHLFPNKYSYMVQNVSRSEVLLKGVGWVPMTGSCPTGPGEMFTEFSFLSLILWFVLGVAVARVDATAMVRPDPLRLAYYAATLCGLTHLILQSYGAGFMAFVFFAGPLWVTFQWARRRPSPVRTRRARGRSSPTRVMVPRPITPTQVREEPCEQMS